MKRTEYSAVSISKVIPSFIFLVLLGSSVKSQSVQTNVPPLKEVFKNDFSIGCLLSYTHVGFPDDPVVPGQTSPISINGGTLIRHHMNSMSPGNNMKAQYTVDVAASQSAFNNASPGPVRDSVDVHPIVRFNGNLIAQLNWAQRQGFTFRGHTLVWHNQPPAAGFFREGYAAASARVSKEKMTQRLGNYIRSVIRLLHENWPGMLSAMDVVNEAVNDNGTDRTANNEWYATFGDMSFIAKAFEFARLYSVEYNETQIKLYYNDYNTHLPAKAGGIVRIVRPVFLAGHLDGIGMQDHDAISSPTASQWIASYNAFDTVCTEMSVTEFDVNPGGAITAPVLAAQANQYASLVKCFVERSARSGRGKIVSVSKDGLNDQYAFVPNASLWDNLYQCKPAYYAVVNVGTYYNQLDSLIDHAGTLQQSDYTPDSWSTLTSSVTAGISARDQNYSASVSADTALRVAKISLEASIAGLVTGIGQDHLVPAQFALDQNFPNPFNPTTVVGYSVPFAGHLSLNLYNLIGEKIAVLFEGHREAGVYRLVFDGSDLPSGVYMSRLQAGDHVVTRQMLLLK